MLEQLSLNEHYREYFIETVTGGIVSALTVNNVNVGLTSGSTALHLLAINRECALSVIESLCSNGANINLRDNNKQSVIESMIENVSDDYDNEDEEVVDRFISIFTYFLQNGYTIQNTGLLQEIELCIQKRRYKFLEILVQHNANTNLPNSKGEHILQMKELQYYASDEIRKILNFGYINADLKISAERPIDSFIQTRNAKLLKIFLEYHKKFDYKLAEIDQCLFNFSVSESKEYTVPYIYNHMVNCTNNGTLISNRSKTFEKYQREIEMLEITVANTRYATTFYDLLTIDINTESIYKFFNSEMLINWNIESVKKFPLFRIALKNKIKSIEKRVDLICRFYKKTATKGTQYYVKQLYGKEFKDVYRKLICVLLSNDYAFHRLL